MKIKYIICLILISVSQILIAGPPRWFGQEISGYSSSRYFVGEGEGNNFSEAIARAQEAVASQLRVAIESQVNSYVSEVSDNDRTELQESFSSQITTTVNETVQGIKVIKRERSKDKYYVSVGLNKAKYLAGLRVEIEQLWSKISRLIRDARDLVDDGKIFTALENYTDAQPFLPPFYVKKSFYDALADSPYRVNEFITVEGIISEVRKLIKGIDLDVTQGNNQIGNTGGLLSSEIVVESLFKKRGITIPNLPLKVKYEDGSIERVSTDDNGQAEIWTTATCMSGDRGKIEVGLDLFKLPKLYKKYFMSVSTTAKFKCTSDMSVAFDVFIEDEDGKRLPKVEQKITKSLEKIGYRVSNDAELALNGTVSIIEENEVQGKNGPVVQLKAELSLLLLAKSVNEIVGSFTSTFVGLGKNQKESLKKAQNKMKIKKKDLSEALADSEEFLVEVLGRKSDKYLKEAKTLYNQNKITQAISSLAKVTYGENQIREARELIKKYKKEREEYWEAKRKQEEEEREKERQKEIELTKIEAEKEMSVAESKAKEKEAEARIAEAKAMMAQAKAEIAKIEKDKLEAEAAIADSEAEAEKARADAISAASDRGDNNDDAPKNTNSLNSSEKQLAGAWEYIGAMRYSDGHESYENSGQILFVNDDRTFSSGSTSGSWSSDGETFYVDGFPVPYVMEGSRLILGFTISGELWLMIYR